MAVTRISESGRIRIERYIEDYIDSGKIAGCSMIVWRGGDELYTTFKGVQDLETRRPIARDTIFRVYSMTKPVASVALMMLFDRGRFDLDDPVERFLPAFSGMRIYDPGGSIRLLRDASLFANC